MTGDALHGEHRLDGQRAFDAVCMLHGADPAGRIHGPAWIGMAPDDAVECSNDVMARIEGWEAVLTPHLAPEGGASWRSPTATRRTSGVMEAAVLGAFA